MATRRTFSIQDKLKLINLLHQHRLGGGTFNGFAHREGIHTTLLRKWVKAEETLRAAADRLPAAACRVGVRSQQTDDVMTKSIHDHLIEYMFERRDNGLPCTVKLVLAEWERYGPGSISLISHHAARQRLYRLMRRNGCSYRRVTHQARRTRREVEKSSVISRSLELDNEK